MAVFGRRGASGFVIKNKWLAYALDWPWAVLTRDVTARCWEMSTHKLLPFPSSVESWLISLLEAVLTVVILVGIHFLLCKWIKNFKLCCPRYENYIVRRFGLSAYIFLGLKDFLVKTYYVPCLSLATWPCKFSSCCIPWFCTACLATKLNLYYNKLLSHEPTQVICLHRFNTHVHQYMGNSE